MAFSPTQTNSSSMSLPANTLDICCLPKDLQWLPTKFKSFKIGLSCGKSRTFNPSLVSQTFTVTSFTDIPRSLFHLCVSPTRVLYGTFLMSAIQPLMHSKRLSLQLQSLCTGSQTPPLQLRLTPLTTHLLPYFQLRLPLATCIQLLSIPTCSTNQITTMTFTTKRYLL